jgi:hypothetical protein
MRPPHYAAAGVLALTLVAACEDSPRPEAAVAPTEQASGASLLTPGTGPNLAVQINDQIASVCKSYRKASNLAKADLARDSTNVDLQADVKAYDALIDDACN